MLLSRPDGLLFSGFLECELMSKYRLERADRQTLEKIRYEIVMWLDRYDTRLACGCRLTNVSVAMENDQLIVNPLHPDGHPDDHPDGCNHG